MPVFIRIIVAASAVVAPNLGGLEWLRAASAAAEHPSGVVTDDSASARSPVEIDWFISPAALSILIERARIGADDTLVLRQLHAAYLEELATLDREASQEVDRAGRTELLALLRERTAPAARIDVAHVAMRAMHAEYLRRADALRMAFLADAGAALAELPEDFDAMANAISVVDSLRTRMARSAASALAPPVFADWIDVSALLASALADGAELERAIATTEATNELAATRLRDALRRAESSYEKELIELARDSAWVAREVPAPGTSWITADRVVTDARQAQLKRRHARLAVEAIEAVEQALAAAGASDAHRAWSLRAWREAAPEAFRMSSWEPDLRRWASSRRDLPRALAEELDTEAEAYEATLDTLRLSAARSAYVATIDERGETPRHSDRDYALAMCRLWSLNVAHFRRAIRMLPEPLRGDLLGAIGDRGPYDPQRLPIFDPSMLEWLVSRGLRIEAPWLYESDDAEADGAGGAAPATLGGEA